MTNAAHIETRNAQDRVIENHASWEDDAHQHDCLRIVQMRIASKKSNPLFRITSQLRQTAHDAFEHFLILQ